MNKTVALVFCVFLAGLMTAGVSFSQSEVKSQLSIRVNGAAMAADQVQAWAKSFSDLNPDVRVVVTGSSAGKGFEALLERQADLALMSREPSADEKKKATAKGLKLTSKLVGHAGLAVVTSPRNSVGELTMEQLQKIFLGQLKNWKEVGGDDAAIRCLSRRVPESGGAVFFQEQVLRNQPFGAATVFSESWGSILKTCSTANDIPIGIAPFTLAKEGVKILALKKDDSANAVAPSDETLRNKSYALIVPITVYWDTQAQSGVTEGFVNFCASAGLM